MMRTLLFVSLAIGAVACGGMGHAEVDSDMEDRTFEFNTVYGWLESHEYEYGEENLVLSELDTKVLYLRLSGATFDPTLDQNFVSFDDILRWVQEENRKGSIFLAIQNGDKAAPGTEFKASIRGGGTHEAEPGEVALVDSRWQFARNEVPGDEPFDEERRYLGGGGGVTVVLDTIGKQPGDVVEGRVEFAYERLDGDPADVKTGKVVVTFSAPLIQQRIAEVNGDGFEL